MASKTIIINEFSKIAPLVAAAKAVDGDVIMKSGRWVVDCRSLLGVMSLALDLGVTVEYPDDAVIFQKYLDENF